MHQAFSRKQFRCETNSSKLCEEALVHLHKIQVYGYRDLEDEAVLDAISMRLAAMIDVLHRLPESVKVAVFGDLWPDIWGMRNRIVHGYMSVDADVVRRTVREDIDALEIMICGWLERQER